MKRRSLKKILIILLALLTTPCISNIDYGSNIVMIEKANAYQDKDSIEDNVLIPIFDESSDNLIKVMYTEAYISPISMNKVDDTHYLVNFTSQDQSDKKTYYNLGFYDKETNKLDIVYKTLNKVCTTYSNTYNKIIVVENIATDIKKVVEYSSTMQLLNEKTINSTILATNIIELNGEIIVYSNVLDSATGLTAEKNSTYRYIEWFDSDFNSLKYKECNVTLFSGSLSKAAMTVTLCKDNSIKCYSYVQNGTIDDLSGVSFTSQTNYYDKNDNKIGTAETFNPIYTIDKSSASGSTITSNAVASEDKCILASSISTDTSRKNLYFIELDSSGKYGPTQPKLSAPTLTVSKENANNREKGITLNIN